MHGDPTVTFGAAGLDRAAHLRADGAALRDLAGGDGALCLALWRGKLLMSGPRILRLPPTHPLVAGRETLFLGLSNGAAQFAADLSDWEPGEKVDGRAFVDATVQHHPLIGPDWGEAAGFAELRTVLGDLDPVEAELAATAKALWAWHQTHGFCARCGAESRIAKAGWQRDCPRCGAQHFPRTDPVVIMLVTRGNRVLVGRSPGWPEGMYSLLAGFMEPGETVEAAVRREVREEAGLVVGRVRYLASQPWPYPSSLMIGCAGEALGDELAIDPTEIEALLWLTREELAEVFAGTHSVVKQPRRGAIAGYLLHEWLSGRVRNDW